MLKGTYFPTHEENLMESEGDVEAARAHYLQARPPNLTALLRHRYAWMNQYIQPTDTVVEFGCGAGFSREFITAPNLILTDVVARPWVDRVADAMAPPFDDGAIDVVICSHMIHHLYSPRKFFAVLAKKLKPNGLVLIQEINTSLMMRALLRVMRHEGWSYEVDVFDESAVANDPRDPWSANCAIPELLFEDNTKFESKIPEFRILRNDVNECLLFPLSGGVISKTRTVQLPTAMLSAVKVIDDALTSVAPKTFALGRSVVLQKSNSSSAKMDS